MTAVGQLERGDLEALNDFVDFPAFTSLLGRLGRSVVLLHGEWSRTEAHAPILINRRRIAGLIN